MALDRFARMVRTYLDVPVALVSLVDDVRQFFPGAAGLTAPYDAARQTPLTHSVCQHVVASGEPLVVSDLREVPSLRDNLAIRDLGAVAYAGMPLTDAERAVLGSLCAIDTEPREWTVGQVQSLGDLAAACSSELRLRVAVRLAAAARRRADLNARRLTVAAEATAIFSTVDASVSMQRLTGLLVPDFADWAIGSLIGEDGTLEHSAAAHRDGKPELLARFVDLLTTGSSPGSAYWQVLDGGPPVLRSTPLDGFAAVDPALAAVATGLGWGSYLVVPLTARGRTIGVLSLISATTGCFDDDDLEFAADLGARAGLAIDNVRLYAGQRQVAEALQRSMLTLLPEPDHLELACRYRASSDEAQIGGDWYDAFLQPDGGTVLVIGDVMGHDISSAGAMGQLRNLLRGTAYDRGDGPGRILERVDAAIRGLQVDVLATCVVARVEQTPDQVASGGRTLRWSNAGHPPPLLRHDDGRLEVLDAEPDLMLGVNPHSERHDHVVDLPAGTVLLMFTDGLVEHRTLTLEDGVRRVGDALLQSAGESLDDLCDAVVDALVGPETTDDLALIAVRAHSELRPRPLEAGAADDPPDLPVP